MNEMMDTILLEALELLEQGLSVDDIVARYPAQAAELRPFLLTAAALSRLATQPAAAAETQSKRAFLATAARAAEQPRARGLAGLGRRLALPIMAVLAVLFLGAAGLVGASAAAMPDDTLYGAKLFVERARLGLAADPERAAALREQFRQERLREVAQLLAAGREADVSLTGPIEAMSGARWMVAGVAVTISPATVIDGAPAIGAEAQIDGRTVGGAVAAARVTILVGAAPQPTPQPTADDRPTTAEPTDDEGMDEPSPGVQPAATITTTPTATATGTATASPSPTLTPPATVSPAPTAAPPTDTPPTATPRPTAPPVPSATPDDDDDNSNDNDGDNENDNDDNANDNGGDDNANDNGGDDNQNDNDSDSDSDNDDNSGSGGGDNDNDNSGGDDDQND